MSELCESSGNEKVERLIDNEFDRMHDSYHTQTMHTFYLDVTAAISHSA